jgi:hypothetical protein
MAITKEVVVQEVKHSIWRTVSVVCVLAIVGAVVFGLITLFKKPTQQIIAKKGSNVQVTQINKSKRTFIPFVEGYVDQRSGDKMGTGIRAGLRFEF